MSDEEDVIITGEYAARLFELFALIVLVREDFPEDDAVQVAHGVRTLFERYVESGMSLRNFLFAIRAHDLDSLLEQLEAPYRDDEESDDDE